jgi:hypothetical protein
MSFKVGSITFPLVYEQVVNDNPAFYKEGDGLPGVLPLLAAIGKKARKITFEGYIYVINQSKTTCWNSYIAPVLNMVSTFIEIETPDGFYDGEWLLDDFQVTEAPAYPQAFKYRLLLVQGSIHFTAAPGVGGGSPQ